ncbi:MAG: TerC family protein [Armatimonadota bacterium]
MRSNREALGYILLWVVFNLFVVAVLAFDLGFVHRKAQKVELKESLLWSALWTVLALAFNLWVYFWRGPHTALEFLTGYLIERALSMDNIFVFVLIFSYFAVPAAHQYRVLFWGILGALIMRAMFIAAGVTLIAKFHWIVYVFGVFLVITGVRMGLEKDKEVHPERNPVLKAFRRFVPVTTDYEDGRFFVVKAGKRLATPLCVVLLVVETTDVVFALDSIPAILAVTRDPFIVYTSNVFAILGLRALYFALAGVMELFQYLHYGLSAILVFIGAKMMLSEVYDIPVALSLGVVGGLLAVSIVASMLKQGGRGQKRGDSG